MKNLFIITLAVTALASSLSSSLAHAASKCKPINKLPAEITISGVYCLKKNLTYASADVPITTGAAIQINAENTVLDLDGFTLSGGAAPTNTSALGIQITADNVTVRNGTVANFRMGIYSSGLANGVVVENMVLVGNKYIGIYFYAKNSLIRNNTVLNTGGATTAANVDAYGIFLDGDGISSFNNTIIDVTSVGTGRASGIATSGVADHCIVSNNTISNIASPSNFDSGIWFESGSLNNIASDNRITNPGSYGIGYNGGGATGVYMNNLVDDAGVSDYAGSGTAAGSTNY